MQRLFKSILEQDKAPIVVCDMESTVVYMNPSAIARYKRDLTGKNLKSCHPACANEKIDRVLQWFGKDRNNNIVYTFRNEKENKEIDKHIMVTLWAKRVNSFEQGYRSKDEKISKRMFTDKSINGLYLKFV